MKRIIITVLCLLFMTHAGQAQKQPYHAGEKIKYQIKYGPVNGGVATLQIKDKEWNNKKVLHATISGKTTGIADAMYKVRDTYESYIDPETDLPVFSIRNISEGKYKKYNEVSFDHS